MRQVKRIRGRMRSIIKSFTNSLRRRIRLPWKEKFPRMFTTFIENRGTLNPKYFVGVSEGVARIFIKEVVAISLYYEGHGFQLWRNQLSRCCEWLRTICYYCSSIPRILSSENLSTFYSKNLPSFTVVYMIHLKVRKRICTVAPMMYEQITSPLLLSCWLQNYTSIILCTQVDTLIMVGLICVEG